MAKPRMLFVYGTLMPGEPRWPTLACFAESTAPAATRGTLWDTGMGFPAARFVDGDGEIPGFVVILPAHLCSDVVARLDEIEDEGVLYRRVEIDTSEGRAMSYEWLGETSELTQIPYGWRPTPER